ncbi:EAL domain-containing protein [Pseudomonas sp. MMS21-TM103]|uniref:EAL domain-containing protein n=1 Tax=Pseudomonas sp. MMS21 TM103 TaxID=2886506 RepID=UPI001EDED08D|nr:EAL domain-containing protein [Pseudomonas sp. MMS21 TM103]MCG4455311.1 EAL domain-containing protein [Pseudomonas sp. MMS21 TM103]
MAQPEPIQITPASSIPAYFQFWEDVAGEASIDQVVALADERWTLVPNGSATFGLTESAYWLRFDVRNQTQLNLNLIAELGYSQLDDVVFYVYAGGAQVKELKTGDSRPFYPRDVDHPNMLLRASLAPEELKTFYVRVATAGSMIVPLRIWREQTFFETAAYELKLHFFYYGCILVIVLINLAVYLSLREKLYLYYALAIFGYLLFFASIKGFSFQHLYPQLPELHAKALLVSIPGLALFSLLFCREFLNTRVHSPRLDKVLLGMMVFEMLFLFSAPLLDYHTGIQVASFSALLFFSLLLVAGPVVWMEGVRAGAFFTLAWTPLTIGVLATSGRALGFFPETFFTEYAMQIGSGLEALILTVALADRLYREREDKIIAQAASLREAQSRNAAQNLLTDALAHDPVTGLPNRNRFEWMVDQQLRQAPHRRYMVGVARITRLDEINRTLGLTRSEWIMKRVAEQMVELAAGLPIVQAILDHQGREERVYHLSSDCFCLLIDVDEAGNDFSALNSALRQLAEPIWLDHLAIELNPRFGAASYPEHGRSAAEMIRNAHVGMEVTPRGLNETGIYSQRHDIYSESRLTLMADLREALQQNQTMLYYQPKQDLKTGHIVGVEALIRWHHQERGWVSPVDFIPLAEETGVIIQLTQWVIGQAANDLAHLHKDYPELSVAINISARDLESTGLHSTLELALQHNGLQACSVTLEITETAAMLDPARSLHALNVLAELGHPISIDDFGSGYSSLSYLKQLPAFELKLDRSLIHDICVSESAAVIVSTAIQMAGSLGYRVVGEGIEDAETARWLQEEGCDTLQGYWLCKPKPIAELKQWLLNFNSSCVTAAK